MFTQNTFENRVNKLQKKLRSGQSILVSNSSDITYFTDFQFLVHEEREAFIFITKKSVNLIHTTFAPINNFSYIKYLGGSFPDQLASHLWKIIKPNNETKEQEIEVKTILIDGETLFVSELDAIKEKISNLKIENYDPNFIRDLRKIKEPLEIEQMKKAGAITTAVMKEVEKKLTSGITELEIKKLINKLFEEHGVNQLAFPTIVAFGTNSALPHHQPSNKKLEDNMAVLIDMGGKISGYCSDMTRTFWFGKNPSKAFLEIETIVKDAYQEAYKKLQNRFVKNPEDKVKNTPSVIKAKDLDNAARVPISNKGYAEEFIHTTGHGLGLSIHEQPSISWKNQTEIEPNMTITIEPGIYLEGEFGYRYENTVLITKEKVNSVGREASLGYGAIELTNQ